MGWDPASLAASSEDAVQERPLPSNGTVTLEFVLYCGFGDMNLFRHKMRVFFGFRV